MHHLTHTQDELAWLIGFAGLIWTVVWCWIWIMAVRLLRWTYLEKKAARRSATRPAPMVPMPSPSFRSSAVR